MKVKPFCVCRGSASDQVQCTCTTCAEQAELKAACEKYEAETISVADFVKFMDVYADNLGHSPDFEFKVDLFSKTADGKDIVVRESLRVFMVTSYSN